MEMNLHVVKSNRGCVANPPLAPAALSRPQHIRRPRSEWMPKQWAVPHRYKQIRDPTPAIPSSDDENGDSNNGWVPVTAKYGEHPMHFLGVTHSDQKTECVTCAHLPSRPINALMSASQMS